MGKGRLGAHMARLLSAKTWSAGQELPGLRETDSPVTGPTHAKSGAAIAATIERTNNALHALVRAITTAGIIYFGNINGTKFGVGSTTNLDAGNWFEVDAVSARTSVTHSVKELIVDGHAGVRGVHLKKSSDVHSGRLFWQSQDKVFMAYLENGSGELRFYSGGTYGASSGDISHRFMPNGDAYLYGELTTVGAATIGGGMAVGADIDGPAEFALTNGLGETIFFSNATNETQILAGGVVRATFGTSVVMPRVYAVTGGTANVSVASDGTLSRVTSAAKYKRDFQQLGPARLASFRDLIGGTYHSLAEMDDPEAVYSGIIADQAHNLGLTDLVIYGEGGEVEGFRYERAVAYLVEENRNTRSELELIRARLAALETA